MICQACKKNLAKAIFYGVEVDYCPECLGLWFEKDELRLAKDMRDRDLNWLDIDLWKKKTSFRISLGEKLCPSCRLPLYQVNYGRSKIEVDFCNLCQGIWLDRGEFKKIIEYLKREGHYEVINNYTKNLIREFWEIFVGPETLRKEVSDFLTILKILNYKFTIQHPAIAKIISSLPK